MTSGVVVGVGHCTVDYLGLVPRFPEMGGTAEIAEFSQQSGGTASTALATMAIFGANTRFVGKVSDDHFGSFIRAGLEGLGVDIEHMAVEPKKVSPFTFSVIDMSEGRRTAFWSRGNVSPLTTEEIDEETILKNASMLILDSSNLEVQLPLAQRAQQQEIPVVVSGGDRVPDIKQLIRFADTLIISERLATDIASASELDLSLGEIQKMGPRRCVITLGAEGSIGIDEAQQLHETQAYCVNVKDTTGAGDVFLGAFCYSLIENSPLPLAMRFASVAAGLTCQRLGARAGIPKLEEVHAQLKNQNE